MYFIRKSVVPSEGETAKKNKPTKAESRKMQREKKRNLEVTKLNNELRKPTPTMKNNKKDRKVLQNQVICSQYSMVLKTRTQRTEELKFLLSLEEDAEKRSIIIMKLKAFLENEVAPINLCDTSSDEEDDSLVPMSAVTQDSVDSSRSPIHKRPKLPGLIEKWNDEADSDEGEHDPMADDDEEEYHSSEVGHEGKADDIYDGSDNDREDDDGTHYSSDTSSKQWRSETFEVNTVKSNEIRFKSMSASVHPPKAWSNKRRNPPKLQVSSYVYHDDKNTSQDQVFTATSDLSDTQFSQMLTTAPTVIESQSSFSASSQVSTTAATSKVVQLTVNTKAPKQHTGSNVTSSSVIPSKKPSTSPSRIRSAQPSSSKSAYFQDPPQSTSKIVTRANKGSTIHEEDIGNNIDIYATFRNDKRKRK